MASLDGAHMYHSKAQRDGQATGWPDRNNDSGAIHGQETMQQRRKTVERRRNGETPALRPGLGGRGNETEEGGDDGRELREQPKKSTMRTLSSGHDRLPCQMQQARYEHQHHLKQQQRRNQRGVNGREGPREGGRKTRGPKDAWGLEYRRSDLKLWGEIMWATQALAKHFAEDGQDGMEGKRGNAKVAVEAEEEEGGEEEGGATTALDRVLTKLSAVRLNDTGLCPRLIPIPCSSWL